MAQLGNVWHIPANPEPPGRTEGMRSPVFPTDQTASMTIRTGNQFAGDGNPGNQLQDGSVLFYRAGDRQDWTDVPLGFDSVLGDNKYYAATVPLVGLAAGTAIQYYLQVAYDDHDTTYLQLDADGITSLAVDTAAAAQASPFSVTVDTLARRGAWSDVLDLPNVGIHAHVLATGNVLMWGRRDSPGQSLDVDPVSPLSPGGDLPPAASCTPFIWDPRTQIATPTAMPMMADGQTNANLFCSGHSFLPDGRLLVAGGHLADGAGLQQTVLYDPIADTWTSSATMVAGRWYPTLTTLTDGSVLILGGSFRNDAGSSNTPNIVPEIWRDGALVEVVQNPAGAFDLYPRMHVASTGTVVTTGSLQQTWALDPSEGGRWSAAGTGRLNGQRDYAPSVLFDADKVIYVGGGSPPSAATNIADIGDAAPTWSVGASMSFPRRQHNATILADGTVLVTGGTRNGGDGPPENFNNLDPGQPIHIAELWDPLSDAWTQLAAESIDRCYHSTAVLLPDGTVLSAGGGEFFPIEGTTEQNDPADSHRNAQLFSPPYLFNGDRPVITSSPESVSYGEQFHVSTPQAAEIAKVTWIRLSSVTHSFNTGQRFASLGFTASGDGLDIAAPAGPTLCPPGHYLLFLINRNGAPSVARITAIKAVAAAPARSPAHSQTLTAVPADRPIPQDALAMRRSVLAAASGTRVIVGLIGTCPYGIAACWGGANEALRRLDRVAQVDPIPDASNSTATVFLSDDGSPPLELWRQQFREIVNDGYRIRGVEVTLKGHVIEQNGQLILQRTDSAPLPLLPLDPNDKVQWDREQQRPEPAAPSEIEAYHRLYSSLDADTQVTYSVTGPLRQQEDHSLEVREFTTVA